MINYGYSKIITFKMKKLILSLLFSSFAFGQQFNLTVNGFADSTDDQKNYVVLDFPGKTKSEMYTATLLFLNKQFNNPNNVIAAIDNEQIVVNAIETKAVLSDLDYFYNDVYTFKDGKIKYEPTLKHLEYSGGNRKTIVPLQGLNGIFSSTGEINKKIQLAVTEYINVKISRIKDSISKELNNDF